MWSYYGSKSNIVHLYPPPKYGKIIEPFAGTARYALKYWDREVLLIDKYEVVIKIWKWLQLCSPGDILKLPNLTQGQLISSLNICDEAKLFLGMWAGVSSTSPRNKISPFAALKNGQKNQFKNVARNINKIKHWEIVHGSFENIKNEQATWFIDPPYQFGGNAYVESDIDFMQLSQWSQNREGQIIVCENTKATWMKFMPIAKHRGSSNTTTEAFWTNLPSSYNVTQTSMY